ncbi:MAG: mechanosensitive ion channel [Clostridiales bacterium]|nr:mechanosensitive ion channel [Clostridiales bacterium]
METFWNEIVTFLSNATADLALKIISAVVMLLVGLKLIKIIRNLMMRSLSKSKLDKSLIGFLDSGAVISLRSLLVISLLMYLGVPAASFIAVLTSLGLAIGLALQGSLSNFAGGLMILAFRHFKAGDYIRTDSADGVVQSISIMYTTLKTLDGKKVVIPNSLLSNGVVTDFSWYDARRVDLSVTTDYAQDVQAVTSALEEAASGCALVLTEPAPTAFLERIQDGTLVFSLRCWARTPDWWSAYLAVNAALKQALDARGIRPVGPVRELRQLQPQARSLPDN